MAKVSDFKQQFHRGNRIHLNNAGLSPISAPARDKIATWARRFYEEGFYSDADYHQEVLESRNSLARLIGCSASEVAFFQSTAGAISQVALNFPLKENDEVLTWDQEYTSNLYPWREACKRSKARLVIAPSNKDLSLDTQRLIDLITPKTKVIAISWVQFQTGAVSNLKEIGKIAKEKGIFFFIDAIQALGLHPFNMKELGVDAVAGGSHKWLAAPVGVGYLALDQKHISYIQPHNIGALTFGTCNDPSVLVCDPKMDALKYEAGSKQVLEIIALGASVDLILKTSVFEIEKEILRLSKKLQQGLLSKGYSVLYNNSAIVNFVPKKETESILKALPCVYALRGPGLRLSPHAHNTDEEIDLVLSRL